MWDIIFIVTTTFLLFLPILPGLFEMSLATDTQPLRVIQEYDTDVAHFANGFKSYLEKNFPNFFALQTSGTIKFADGSLDNRTRYQIIGHGSVPFFDQKEVGAASTQKLIVSAEPLALPRDMFFESEVYSASSVKVGSASQLRALLAEGDIVLGQDCTVVRWVHSNSSLFAEPGCMLFGRASATNNIVLAENCQFERINARQIVFGQMRATINPDWAKNRPVKIDELARVKDRYERRWLIDGDIELPAGSLFDGDIVASKNIIIGAGTHIIGSLKSNKDLYIAAGVRIDGSIFADGNITIEAGCRIFGPVVAERNLVIKDNTIIGSETTPTTVTAERLLISSGVVTYGTIWADDRAFVAAAANGGAVGMAA